MNKMKQGTSLYMRVQAEFELCTALMTQGAASGIGLEYSPFIKLCLCKKKYFIHQTTI